MINSRNLIGQNGCNSDSDCTGGKSCIHNLCTYTPSVLYCTTDSQCSGNKICKDGKCIDKPNPSTNNALIIGIIIAAIFLTGGAVLLYKYKKKK
jgi:LPXTG-motif cell wall-anchored protein